MENGMKITNNLSKTDIHTYIQVDNGNTVGAGAPDSNGDRKKKVKANGGKLIITPPSNAKDDFKLFIILDDLPKKDGVEGVKVSFGKSPGIAHHTEFYKTEHEGKTKDVILIHYDLRGKSDEAIERIFTHEDPEVSHPENGRDW